MKRLIYIAVIAVGFLAVSCSKENIHPNPQKSTLDVPEWKSIITNETLSTDVKSDGSGAITDPNIDKDESARKKN